MAGPQNGSEHAAHAAEMPRCGSDLRPQDDVRQRGQHDHGEQQRARHGEGLGEGERAEEFPLARGEREDGQEAADGGGYRGEDGGRDLGGANAHSRRAITPWGCRLHVGDDVLREHDAHVDHRPDRDRDPSQRHHVGIDPRELHQHEREQHAQRQHRAYEERGAQLAEEDQHDDDHDDDLLRERGLQRVQRVEDQPRPIVEGHDGDLRDGAVLQGRARQARRDLGDARLHAIDGREWVLPVARDDHASHGVGAGVVQSATTQGRAELHVGHVSHANGRVILAQRDDGLLDILGLFDEAASADDVLGAVDLDGARTRIEVGAAHGVGDLRQADPLRAHRLGVDVDLILLNVAANRRDLGDTVHAHQGVAHGPILDGAQLLLREAADHVAVGVVSLERVPIHLPERGGVGTEPGRHALRHGTRWQ